MITIIAMAAAALAGLGLWLIIFQFIPTQPHLGDAVAHVGTHQAQPLALENSDESRIIKMGNWAQRTFGKYTIPGWLPPQADIDLVGARSVEVLGTKVFYVIIAVVATPVWFILTGNLMPTLAPLMAVTGIVIGWLLPNQHITTKAKQARREFKTAVMAMAQWLALGRTAGLGITSALTEAVSLSDAWPFTRMRQRLRQGEFVHEEPWDALKDLGTQLQVVELEELAEVTRMSAANSANVANTLASISSDMTNAETEEQRSLANEQSKKLTIPSVLILFVLVAAIIYPALQTMQ